MRTVFRIVNLIFMVGLLFLVCSFSRPKPVLAYIDDDTIFINEIHYTNAGDDTGEAVEIAGPSGTNLTGWQLVVYDGGTGLVESTIHLTQTIPETASGHGVVVVETPGLFDEGPGGLALVKPDSSAAMFLSVEGSFTAADGPAEDKTSTDLEVAELGTDVSGYSLQLSGLGMVYSDFTWQSAAAETFGGVNTNQFFGEVFINEIHYLNTGIDVNEGVEVAGPAGYSLLGWKILIYNPSNGYVQTTKILSETIPDQQNGFGTQNYLISGLYNNTSGIALVDSNDQLVQFLSYCGKLKANSGIADGEWSVNISETDPDHIREFLTTPVDHSLQLAGQGVKYSGFTWQPPAVHTRGEVNNNQTLGFDVNTPPTAAEQTVSTNEDTLLSITLSADDANDDPLTYHLDQDVLNGTLTVDTTNEWSYTPDPDFYGTDYFTFYANDGKTNGNSATVTITVGAVNDAPSFTPGADIVIDEDAEPQTISAWATAISKGPQNESAQSLTFELTVTSGDDLFSTAPAIDPASGDLSFTPAADAFGIAALEIYLTDDGGIKNDGEDTSPVYARQITINPVNDKPSFTAGNDITVLEDSPTCTEHNWAVDISPGPDNEAGQILQFNLNIDQPDLFETLPSLQPDGTLTFTPAADAFGTTLVEVILTDDGGTANGGENQTEADTFQIEIHPVNDAPHFTPGENIVVDEDAGAVTIPAWAVDIQAGQPNEADQTLTFSLQPISAADLFFDLPEIDPSSGNLTFTSAENAYGIAEFTVLLQDNGGTENGGVDTSAEHRLTITIHPVNDAPIAAVDSYHVKAGEILHVTSPGVLVNDGDVDGDSLSSFVSSQPEHGSLTLNADGAFEYAPSRDFSGEDMFSYQACDDESCSEIAWVTITVEAKEEEHPFQLYLPMLLR